VLGVFVGLTIVEGGSEAATGVSLVTSGILSDTLQRSVHFVLFSLDADRVGRGSITMISFVLSFGSVQVPVRLVFPLVGAGAGATCGMDVWLFSVTVVAASLYVWGRV